MDGDRKEEHMEVEEKKEIGECGGGTTLQIPRKDHVPQSKGSFEDEVRVSLFRMTLDPDMIIYKYRVDIKKIRREKETDLTKGPKSDVATQQRRRVFMSLLSDFLKKSEKNGHQLIGDKYGLAYDCANILYASKPL